MAILEKLPDDQMNDISGGYLQEVEGDSRCMVIDDEGNCRAGCDTREEAEKYALEHGYSTDPITWEQRLELLGLS